MFLKETIMDIESLAAMHRGLCGKIRQYCSGLQSPSRLAAYARDKELATQADTTIYLRREIF